MTVSEFIYNFIEKIGCKKVFMVSGSSAMWLTDALYRNDKLEAICCHHEQVAAMAADGYARVNRVPGACLVTIGPGVTNAITGVAQAYFDSTPMFVLSGQGNSKLLSYAKESGIRQNACQSMYVEPVVSSITNYCTTVMNPADIRYIMERAYYEAINGRKGPVWIDVPVDIQNRQIPDDIKGFKPKYDTLYDGIDYKKIANLLENSKRPLIFAGFGVRDANAVEELNKLSYRYHIPIVTSRGGIDVIDSNSEFFVGRPGGYGDRASHFAIQSCDFMLILGCRLSVSTIGYYPNRLAEKAIKVMIDIDEKELERNVIPIQYKYKKDVKEFIKLFLDALETKGVTFTFDDWISYCKKNKEKYPVVLPEYETRKPLNCYYFISVLSDIVSSNSNIIVDTGSVYCMTSQSWKIKNGQRYIGSGGFSCMGSWATAIGAYQEGRNLIAISGDGATQMNIQEFATLQYTQIPLKLFVLNNNGYMLIRHNQHNYMDDRFLGVGPDSGLKTPSFFDVAIAFGVKAFKITSDDDLREKIREVLDADGPIVCEVMIEEFAEIIPKIASRVMPDGSLKAADFDDLYPFLDEER